MPSLSKLLGFVLLSTAAASSLRSDVSDPMTGTGMTNMNQMDGSLTTPTDRFEQFEESFQKKNVEHEESFHKMNEERDLSHDAKIEDLEHQIEETMSPEQLKLKAAIDEANEKYQKEFFLLHQSFETEKEAMSAEHMQAAKKYHGEHLAQLATDASDAEETGDETDGDMSEDEKEESGDNSLLESQALLGMKGNPRKGAETKKLAQWLKKITRFGRRSAIAKYSKEMDTQRFLKELNKRELRIKENFNKIQENKLKLKLSGDWLSLSSREKRMYENSQRDLESWIKEEQNLFCNRRRACPTGLRQQCLTETSKKYCDQLPKMEVCRKTELRKFLEKEPETKRERRRRMGRARACARARRQNRKPPSFCKK